MKVLFLLRHAKSSWADPDQPDRKRPLNKRGKRDAPRMGRWLAQQPTQPQHIVSSPALRALTTAIVMAENLGIPSTAVVRNQNIYEATPKTLIGVIQQFGQLVGECDRVMLVGHNPGLTALLNRIDGVSIDNVPTSGLAIVEFPNPTWEAVDIARGNLVKFQYPKQLDLEGFPT